MKACKFCGVEVDNTKRKCPNCGSTELIRVCDNCGAHFDGNFCPNCGVRVGQKGKTCPECQTVYYTNACPNCGYSALRENSAEPVQQTVVHKHVYVNTPMPQKTKINVTVKKKKKRWWLWVLVILVLAGLFGRGGKKEETKTVKVTSTPVVVITEAPAQKKEETETVKKDNKDSSASGGFIDALFDAVMEEDNATEVPTVDISAKMDDSVFLSLLADYIPWCLMPRDKVEDIALQDRHVDIKIYLTRNDVTLDRFSDVTDYILSVEGGLDLWDSVTIDFGELGSVTKTKDDIVRDGKRLHFAVDKKDFKK